MALATQRSVGRWLSPLWVPLVTAVIRFGAGYRIENAEIARREYRRIRAEDASRNGTLVICANHLTLIDSFLIAWALGSPGWYLLHYESLPWNVPERRNFAVSIVQKIAMYVMKSLPITRGGNRGDVARVLADIAHVLSQGDVCLLFPEAGRGRGGRIDVEAAAPGVGRIIRSLERCRVLCVYMRGRSQQTFSDYPKRGERFDVSLRLIEPKSEHEGLRGSREVSRQVLAELADMERGYFDAR